MPNQSVHNLRVQRRELGPRSRRIGLLKERTGVPLFLLFLSEINTPQSFEIFSFDDAKTRYDTATSDIDKKAWLSVLSFFEAKGHSAHIAAFPFNAKKPPLSQMIGTRGGPNTQTGLQVVRSYTEIADLLYVPQASHLLSGKTHQQFYKNLFGITDELEHYFVIVDFPINPNSKFSKYRNLNAAAYGTWLTYLDTSIPPGAVVTAAIQQSDDKHGLQQTPSNQKLQGRIRPLYCLSPAEVRKSLEQDINLIHEFGAKDLRIWGSQTLGDSNTQIATRRSLLAIREALHQICEPFVLEPAGPDLNQRVEVSIHSFLQSQAGLLESNTSKPFSTKVTSKIRGGTQNIFVEVRLHLPYALDEVSLAMEVSQ